MSSGKLLVDLPNKTKQLLKRLEAAALASVAYARVLRAGRLRLVGVSDRGPCLGPWPWCIFIFFSGGRLTAKRVIFDSSSISVLVSLARPE